MNLGEALYTARVAAGLTQEQLARRTGITQAALSRYENDMRFPDSDTLEQLASAVGVTPRLLAELSLVGIVGTDAHMRRRATAPARIWRRLEAQINLLREHLRLLLFPFDFRPPNSLSRMDTIDFSPTDIARLIRAQWRVPQGPIRNLTRWVESSGCLVVEWDFGTYRVDGLSQWVDDYPIILLNSRMPTDRKRMTLAHELGHIVMHSDPAHIHFLDDLEQEANAFAAEFLMPAHIIRPDLRNHSLERLVNLKRKWGVSIAALIERGHSLNTIPSSTRTSLYKRLGARGWRRREPISEALPPEKPETVGNVVRYFEQLAYQPDQIADLAGFADANSAGNVLPLRKGLRAV